MSHPLLPDPCQYLRPQAGEICDGLLSERTAQPQRTSSKRSLTDVGSRPGLPVRGRSGKRPLGRLLRRPTAGRPSSRRSGGWCLRSDLRLFGYFEGVVDLDAEIADGRLQLRVAEQQLHGAQILRSLVDQRCLRPPHRVRAIVGWVETQFLDPAFKDPSVLPRSQMW